MSIFVSFLCINQFTIMAKKCRVITAQYKKAYRTDIPPEHYCVHLNRYNNISVKQNSESRAKK